MSPWRGGGLTGAVVAAVLSAAPSAAQQRLIPAPYPSEALGAEPLDPVPAHGGPQTIMRDPYPQTLGADAQGNPPIARRHRHQHLVPSINQRKYRVDRYGR